MRCRCVCSCETYVKDMFDNKFVFVWEGGATTFDNK